MPSYFHQLHQQTPPLLLATIWDPASAVLAQQQGAKALGTSSAALARSLGYADGQQLPVAELLAAVQRIRRVSQLPFTVDIEQGYSDDPTQVWLSWVWLVSIWKIVLQRQSFYVQKFVLAVIF